MQVAYGSFGEKGGVLTFSAGERGEGCLLSLRRAVGHLTSLRVLRCGGMQGTYGPSGLRSCRTEGEKIMVREAGEAWPLNIQYQFRYKLKAV